MPPWPGQTTSDLDQPQPGAPGINGLDTVLDRRGRRARLPQAQRLGLQDFWRRDLQRKPRKAGGGVVALAGAGALPDVDPKVMVIAPRGQKRRAAPLAGRGEADGAG